MSRALVLVDGEHYPAVTRAAIEALSARHDIVGAAMLGGGEKLDGPLVLGEIPVFSGSDAADATRRALHAVTVDVVVDLSDAPVVDEALRMRLAAIALAGGAAYEAAGMRLDPPSRPRRTDVPVVAIVGTGKRTGKTAVSAALARHAARRGVRPVIVAMGRGGPADPVVTNEPPTLEHLLALADAGEHAASDTYEGALVGGVTTVGARRAGAGPLGGPAYDTVAAAIRVAEAQSPDLIVLEGSGTAVPPARAGATLLVVGGASPAPAVTGGLAAYRVLISDLCVVTMAEEPVLSSETLAALTSSLTELAPDVPIIRTVFRPTPLSDVSGRKVFYATTAPRAVGARLVEHLERTYGAILVGVTHHLSDRPKLRDDLARAAGTYDVLLTELKAAAVDVAARAALDAGAEVVFCDNEPVPLAGDDLDAAFDALIARAQENR